MIGIVNRVRRERLHRKLSIRKLASVTGISFSTLARAERGEGNYEAETERRLRAWLGEDVSATASAAEIAKAEELGRIAAQSFQREILGLIRAALKQEER